MHIADTLLPDWLGRCAENTPGKQALKFGEICWTFSELDQQTNRLARQFAAAGIGTTSRVALLATNGLAYVTCVHALTRLRAILVPLNTRLTQEELRWQLEDVHASHLLNDSRYEAQAAELHQHIPDLIQISIESRNEERATSIFAVSRGSTDQQIPEIEAPLFSQIDLNATQVIMYTSGTTGHPKGVLITYGMQWWNAIGSALNLGHQADDCWLACLPFFHIGGLSIVMRSIIYGISMHIQEKFDAGMVNKAIHEDGITIISVVAIILQRMLAELGTIPGSYPATLRCVLLGGGPASRSLLEACAERNIPVVQTYGLTESCSQAATLSPPDALRKPGSAGRPLMPVQLRIVREGQDQQWQPVPRGEPGIIFLKGPTITPGYVDRPNATARTFQDGWLNTGDMGYLDDEGYLYVLDRRTDLIVSGGENIYPAEIENVLQAHPDVAEAGVCAQVDPQWGQIPIAFVRLQNASDVEQLHAHIARHLARYKRPRAIYLVAELPRNSLGKLLRRELPRLLPADQ